MISNNFNLPFYPFYPFHSAGNEENKTVLKRHYYESLYYGVFANVLLGLYQYEDVPKEIKDTIDRCFFFHNFVCAVRTNDFGIVIAPCNPIGKMNYSGQYNEYQVEFLDGTTKTYKYNDKDFVVGTNTTLPCITDSEIAMIYGVNLTEIKLSILNATILSRVLGVFTGTENDVKNALKKWDKLEIGVPFMIELEDNDNDFKLLQFTDNKIVANYYDTFRDTINEFLSVTGFSSIVNPNKKERLIVDEVENNNDFKNTILRNKIENRKDFIKNINEKFGTDYKVEVNTEISEYIDDLKNISKSNDNEDEE